MNTLKAKRLKRLGLLRQLLSYLVSICDGRLIIVSAVFAHIVYFNFFHTLGSWEHTLTGATLGVVLTVLVMRNRGIYK